MAQTVRNEATNGNARATLAAGSAARAEAAGTELPTASARAKMTAPIPREIEELVESVGRLREDTELPICIGFGISRPEHVRRLLPVADGLIVGSAIVRRVARADERPREEVLAEIDEYVGELLAALEKV